MRNGGTATDRENYYDNLGATYWNANAQLDSYHAMRMGSFLSLVDQYLPKSDVFDFGCGTGETIIPLLERGFQVNGCDISQTMVNASKLIEGVGQIEKGGVELLANKTALNNVIVLNVLPYLTQDEEQLFWSELSRLMSKGSVVIGSHTNMLFDLFTFNRYTVEFYKKNLIQYFPRDMHAHLIEKLENLITHPDLPLKETPTWLGATDKPAASERDKIPKRRVCPFEYPHQVEKNGFSLLEIKPVNVFALPPLITEKSTETVLIQQTIQNRIDNPVLAKLLCSQFQFAFVKD
jgi:2-polyprenyl-3-methyl-5-hydroxy-6-metoxy-1,4-benzoquinol methylase